MRHNIIKYQLKNATVEAWHEQIAAFISALDTDPDLKGKIAYRCLKERDGMRYFHLAAAADAQAVSTLQQKEFFKRYTAESKRVSGGELEVLPLELIAETVFRG